MRTVAYSAAGSALWALLPVIGQRQLGLGAAGFGLLMGCLGTGAVGAGLVIGRLRARARAWSRWCAVGCVVFAAAMLVAAFVALAGRWSTLALVAGGGGVDGGDVDLQHRHADQRAALGARARRGDAHAVRARARSRSARRSGARCRASSA